MMKKTISREEAIKILEELHFEKMTKQERLECLEELWISCDSEEWFNDDELLFYSKEIRDDMVCNEKPRDPLGPKYDFIIKDMLKGMFYGVKNSYLLELLLRYNMEVSSIIGNNDHLDECPCCKYKTIHPGDNGFCQICPVCFWENLGEGPNHITLKEAQENFRKFGAMSKSSLDFVDPEGKKKYEKTIVKNS